MFATPAIAATLGTMVTIAVADDGSSVREMRDLLEHGFHVVADGDLLEGSECTSFTMRVLPTPTGVQQQYDNCRQLPGSFRRLKNNDDGREFVCVSFRKWSCYQTSSEREVKQ